MTNYEVSAFVWVFEVLISPQKYWYNGASWEIAKYIPIKILKTTKLGIQNSKFISPTCDEIITMDNASWGNVHGYIVQDWCQIPVLLNVQ